MGDTAARWVDELVPAVGYRHWVLSFAGPMAVRLGYDTALLQRVTLCFAKRVMQNLRRRTKVHHGRASVAGLHPGMITVVRRASTEPAAPDGSPRRRFAPTSSAGARGVA